MRDVFLKVRLDTWQFDGDPEKEEQIVEDALTKVQAALEAADICGHVWVSSG